MPNTGNRITLTLRKRNITTDTLTGETKPNLPGDPDYVPPVYDPESCPVLTTLACPVVRAAGAGAGAVFFEFSLPATTLANLALVQVVVLLKLSGSTVDTMVFEDFDPNYLSGTFTGLADGTYTIDLQYKDAAVSVIHSCTDTATVELAPVITWEGIDPECETVASCEPGEGDYDEDTDTCIEIDEVAATPPSGGGGTPANAWEVNNEQWNNGGGQIFEPGYSSNGSGAIAATLTTPHFWVNGFFQWDVGGRNTTDSRMNAAGIWVDGETTDPVNEWIGFVRRIDTPVAKTVYIGMCADNKFRFSLNGTLLVDCPGTINGGTNFHFMNIYPVELEAGVNYIEMWALNTGLVAGFAVEIYDQDFASLAASTELADLNIIFSTADMIGEPFDLGDTVGWSCPSGYSLDTTGVGDPVCRIVTNNPPVYSNTGIKNFTNRRRLVNGVPDGFEEPNIDGVGVGPYIEPVEDLTTCPL